jgi:hypothetical protein
MRRPAGALLSLATLAVLLLLPTAAQAFPLSNCILTARSLDANGTEIATIQGGADDATQTNPFLVDWAGTIAYQGSTAPATIQNHRWHVDVFGLPTPLQGANPNAKGDQTGQGTVNVAGNAPFRFTGLYYVSGAIAGAGGSCEGNGWLKVLGDPIGTIPFYFAVGGGVIAILLLLLVAFDGALTAAIVGGVLGGLALATLLVIYSAMPVGTWTPIASFLLALIVAFIAFILGQVRHRRRIAAATKRLGR